MEAWFKNRPKWLQDAARRLVQNETLFEQDYIDLYTICLAEATNQACNFSGLTPGVLGIHDTKKSIRLETITDVQGVNALCLSKPLEFNSPLCIVYGRNGAGKSGYVRLLKHACGKRCPGELLPDVFKADSQPQSAKFTFTEDTKIKSSQWTGNALPELGGVDVYDTACGLVYVNEENEVTFEPWLLRFFTQLTSTCGELNKRIQSQIATLVSKKPNFPVQFATTPAATWYANISPKTDNLESETSWRPDHEAKLADINKRLAEADPTGKAAEFRRQKTAIMKLLTDLKSLYESFAEAKCNSYLQMKAEAKAKRTAANEDAKKAFDKAPLTGIDSPSWPLLWEAARKYSQEQAYKTVSFPNVAENARCVLCQRKLDQESKDRFMSFEKFIKGELQCLAKEAEDGLQRITNLFPNIQTFDGLSTIMAAAGITDESIKVLITNFAAALEERKQKCLSAGIPEEINTPLPPCDVCDRLETLCIELEKQAADCDEDAKGQNRPQLEQKVKELSARKWLNQQRQAIEDEIARLAAIEKLRMANTLTNTTALSRRKTELSEELITNAYAERFNTELKNLKVERIFVELKRTKTAVGRVYHGICLKNVKKNAKIADILSEGEFRIISLAAFLADAEGRGAYTPFIFDDPISSLDQVYEEATAQRLVKLSESRQVIVFTHRLSLFGLLEKYAEKQKVTPKIICLSQYAIGEITDLPINFKKKTEKFVHTLLNERLAAAKKAFTQGDTAYENEAKGLCHDIRVLIERMVEKDLLNEVVQRFSPEVNTKGKIHALAKISEEDCNFIDEYMTKYSRYEHSQPDEAPILLPQPDEIETDLNAIKDFIKKITDTRYSSFQSIGQFVWVTTGPTLQFCTLRTVFVRVFPILCQSYVFWKTPGGRRFSVFC
ncbi:MAG: hypothetical protein HQK96_14290 [Nitrospirae bacterium]|nr:hypothetical protein [Nitrospirota bacterium]